MTSQTDGTQAEAGQDEVQKTDGAEAPTDGAKEGSTEAETALHRRKRAVQDIIDTQAKWQSLLTEEWERIEREKEELMKERAALEAVREERELLRQEKEALQALQATAAAGGTPIHAKKKPRTASMSDKVKLDVGGQTFATTISTLQGHNSTYFQNLFAGPWQDQLEDDGTLFIDRDPSIFRHVLNFLRGIAVPMGQLTALERQQLEEDAVFYGIVPLQETLRPAWREFPFTAVAAYDNKGVIYHLATKGGTKPWVNPMVAGIVTVTTSGLHCGSASAVVGNGVQSFGVNNAPNNWVCIDLHGRLVKPRGYVLSHSSDIEGYYCLRSWALEGSADGAKWTLLRSHGNEVTFEYGRNTACWPIEVADVEPCSMFRIMQTGPDSSNFHYLMCSGFEIYGELQATD